MLRSANPVQSESKTIGSDRGVWHLWVVDRRRIEIVWLTLFHDALCIAPASLLYRWRRGPGDRSGTLPDSCGSGPCALEGELCATVAIINIHMYCNNTRSGNLTRITRCTGPICIDPRVPGLPIPGSQFKTFTTRTHRLGLLASGSPRCSQMGSPTTGTCPRAAQSLSINSAVGKFVALLYHFRQIAIEMADRDLLSSVITSRLFCSDGNEA